MSLENLQSNKSENSQEQQEKSIEEQANYEGNHSLLLFERLNNPVILGRLVEDLYEDVTTQDYSTYDYVDSNFLAEHNEYISQDRHTILEDIRNKLNNKLNLVKKSTEIHFSEQGYLASSGVESPGKVGILNSSNPHNIKETVLLKNITEAHEKGHVFRKYQDNSNFTKRIQEPFDFSQITLSQEESDSNPLNNDENITLEENLDSLQKYMASPDEIIERMSQIKNYFGFSGNEKFTQEHLDYVRDNYVKDTGVYPNQIKPFFDAITDDRKFIEKMNTFGI